MNASSRSVTLELLGTLIELRDLRSDTAELLAVLLRREARGEPCEIVDGSESAGDVLANLTRAVVTNSPLLCMHAGVVAAPAGLIAVPGASGLGKTTLTAALVRAGFGYVSDEVLAIDRSGLVVSPFARPLGLDRRSWQLLGLDGAAPGEREEALVEPRRLGTLHDAPGAVRLILLPERDGQPPRLDAARRGDAVTELLRRAFNHYTAPEQSFRAIVRLVRGAEVLRATYSDAPELAALLAERFGVQSGLGADCNDGRSP